MTLPGIDLAMARREAEAAMWDTCTVGYEKQSETLNEQTGLYDPIIAEPVYSGPCQLMDGRAARPVDAAGQLLIEQVSILKLPIVGTAAVRKDMVVRITAAAFDTEHVGLRLRITGPYHKTYATSRRFVVEEIQ